ncbi:MAG: 3'-5' exonuclease [Candidatus Competibacteraceae bacterium]
MLKARMVLLLDPVGNPTGYVLTLEDISAALATQVHEEAIRRVVTRDLRGSAANLRAAAENLSAFPDIEPGQRRAFYDILFKESTLLSQRIEKLASEYQSHSVGVWPMTEIHAPGLLHFLAHRLQESHGIHLAVVGEAHWLHGNSYSLSRVLSYFIEHIAAREKIRNFEIEAVQGRSRMYLELRWQGHPLPVETLHTWLETPLTALLGATLGEVLERHSSEPWSQAHDNGAAVLRIPLKPPVEPRISAEESAPPPRPEFYDFDLMYAHSFTGALEDRPLRDLTYVVFDTETTGLKPTGGDEIIQIAAVRVTKGRVLSGETFDSLVNPGRSIPKDSIRFHGITDAMVQDQPPITRVLPQFHTFVRDAVLVAHNATFDMKFLKLEEAQCGIQFQNPVIDSLLLSLLIEGEAEDHSLDGISASA